MIGRRRYERTALPAAPPIHGSGSARADSSESGLGSTAFIIESTVILAAVIPIYLLVKQALTPELESFAWPPVWVPRNLTLAHLESVFALAELRSAVVLSVGRGDCRRGAFNRVGTMLAYAMARRERLRQAGMAAVTAARLLPMIAVALPLALVLIRVGLYDSATGMGLALIHAALAIPTDRAHRLQRVRRGSSGAGGGGVSGRRVDACGFSCPLTFPRPEAAIAASLVLSFIMSWDEFGFALLIQVTHRTLPPLLYYYTVFGDVGPASALALIMLCRRWR